MKHIPHISNSEPKNNNIWGNSNSDEENVNTSQKGPESILIVDSSPERRAEVCRKMSANGFTVTETSSKQEAIEVLHKTKIDMIVLDASIFDFPLESLTQEADYYVIRPYTTEDFIRRVEEDNHSVKTRLQYGDITINQLTRQVTRNGNTVDLSTKEFRLLEYLAMHQGEILTRQQLLRDVWDKNFDTNTNVINVYMRYLRSKIGDPYPGKIIQTIAGEGYRFAPAKNNGESR